jgi:hypothetical protein
MTSTPSWLKQDYARRRAKFAQMFGKRIYIHEKPRVREQFLYLRKQGIDCCSNLNRYLLYLTAQRILTYQKLEAENKRLQEKMQLYVEVSQKADGETQNLLDVLEEVTFMPCIIGRCTHSSHHRRYVNGMNCLRTRCRDGPGTQCPNAA